MPLALWLAWPAAALALVALCYLGLGARGFSMGNHGRMQWAAQWLFAPYRLGAAINAWGWTRKLPVANEVLPGVWLARLPHAAEWQRAGQPRLVSLCAELQAPRPARLQGKVRGLPLLDLVTPTPGQLRHAAAVIEGQHRRAKGQAVWVCCALGFSRSAASLMAWLLLTGRAAGVDEAESLLRAARPAIVISPALRQALQALLDAPALAAPQMAPVTAPQQATA
jgi:protein-tyrosine phosphatase